MTSQLRHHYVVSYKYDKTFYNFSVTRIVRMVRAKNYEKLSNFVKVTAKIPSVTFFGTWCSWRVTQLQTFRIQVPHNNDNYDKLTNSAKWDWYINSDKRNDNYDKYCWKTSLAWPKCMKCSQATAAIVNTVYRLQIIPYRIIFMSYHISDTVSRRGLHILTERQKHAQTKFNKGGQPWKLIQQAVLQDQTKTICYLHTGET